MIDDLLALPRLTVDTAPIIYFLSGGTPRAAVVRRVLVAAACGELELVMSTVTEAELLVAPLRLEDPEPALKAIRDLVEGPAAFDIRDVSRPIAQ